MTDILEAECEGQINGRLIFLQVGYAFCSKTKPHLGTQGT